MKFTFGIITIKGNEHRVGQIIESIRSSVRDDYQIVIVGGNDSHGQTHIRFDETVKKAWITRKKNLITENAIYENIVYMHDYVALTPMWYDGFLSFGSDWDVCMTVITNGNDRYRDWCLNPLKVNGSALLLPYDEDRLIDHMYISGAYWVAKKHIMEEYPLDETLCWGEGEDAEWSLRCMPNIKYVMNTLSGVKLLKAKSTKLSMAEQKTLNKLKGCNERS